MSDALRVGVVAVSPVLGGAERYLADLYRGLRPRGIEGTLLGHVPEWASTGLQKIDLRLGPKWSRSTIVRSFALAPMESSKALRAIRRQHDVQAFDAFHAQYKREQVMLSARLARLAPVVWTEHGRFYRGRGSSALACGYRHAAEAVEVVICCSQAVADDVDHICRGRVRCELIPNGVDVKAFRRLPHPERRRVRAEFGVKTDKPVLAVVSRLHPAKRIDRAIELAAKAGLELIVVGDGPDAERLHALGKNGVIFTGHRDDVARVLGAADALVVCGAPWGEGIQLTMAEAAAAGCALIGFSGDALELDVRESGGVVVGERSDPAQAFESEVLARAGDAAAAWSLRFSQEEWLWRTADVFRAATAGAPTT